MITYKPYVRVPKTVLAIQYNDRSDIPGLAEMLGEKYGVTIDGPTRVIIIYDKRKFYVRRGDWVTVDNNGLVSTHKDSSFKRDFNPS